jgi:hypothetical protein
VQRGHGWARIVLLILSGLSIPVVAMQWLILGGHPNTPATWFGTAAVLLVPVAWQVVYLVLLNTVTTRWFGHARQRAA